MDVHLHTYKQPVRDAQGRTYIARAEGERQPDGSWHGWFAFAQEGTGEVFRTERETTQADRDDLEYWASGIEPVYLEGALTRAREGLSQARPEE